jgi:hypothetical protein
MLAAVLVLFVQAAPLHAATQTWFGFQIGVNGGNAPPPVFRTAPRVIVVNDVQVVDDTRCDDDVFCADHMWWRLRGGYWYRSGSWRGPWYAVDVRRVPERVLVVPARNWKHYPRHDERSVVVVHNERERYDRHDNGEHRGDDRGRGHKKDHDDHDDHGHDGDDH